jgi:signal transduction histidine kinase
MQTMVGERDERAVSALAQAINDHIYFRLLLVNSLASRAVDSALIDFNEILSNSDPLLSEFEGGLAFIELDGTLLAVTGELQLWENITIGEEIILHPIYSQENQAGFISDPFPHPSNTAIHMALVGARLPGHERIAVGAFSVEALGQRVLAGSLLVDHHINAFLVDPNLRLIYQAGDLPLPEPIESHPGVLEALRGESGTLYRTAEDVEKVVIFHPVPLTGWALIVEEPWETATSPLLRTTVFAPLVLAPVLLLALVALGFVTRQIIQPMQALAEKTAKLSWGEFEAIKEPVGGIAEIHHLQAGLNHLSQKVQSAQQNLHSYIGAITAGQEEERRRLARELHDDTIQTLIALKQRVQLLQMDVHNDPTSRSLGELESLTEQAVDNLRRLTRDLRPIYLEDLGLVTALQMLSVEAEKMSGIPVHFQIKGTEKRLPPAIELALYRIAQEALNNVAQHSQAANANLTINFSLQGLTLEVSDDGKGFQTPKSPADLAPEGHYGLLGIHERVELIGATLSIQSSSQQGTLISVWLPENSINRNDLNEIMEEKE